MTNNFDALPLQQQRLRAQYISELRELVKTDRGTSEQDTLTRSEQFRRRLAVEMDWMRQGIVQMENKMAADCRNGEEDAIFEQRMEALKGLPVEEQVQLFWEKNANFGERATGEQGTNDAFLSVPTELQSGAMLPPRGPHYPPQSVVPVAAPSLTYRPLIPGQQPPQQISRILTPPPSVPTAPVSHWTDDAPTLPDEGQPRGEITFEDAFPEEALAASRCPQDFRGATGLQAARQVLQHQLQSVHQGQRAQGPGGYPLEFQGQGTTPSPRVQGTRQAPQQQQKQRSGQGQGQTTGYPSGEQQARRVVQQHQRVQQIQRPQGLQSHRHVTVRGTGQMVRGQRTPASPGLQMVQQQQGQSQGPQAQGNGRHQTLQMGQVQRLNGQGTTPSPDLQGRGQPQMGQGQRTTASPTSYPSEFQGNGQSHLVQMGQRPRQAQRAQGQGHQQGQSQRPLGQGTMPVQREQGQRPGQVLQQVLPQIQGQRTAPWTRGIPGARQVVLSQRQQSHGQKISSGPQGVRQVLQQHQGRMLSTSCSSDFQATGQSQPVQLRQGQVLQQVLPQRPQGQASRQHQPQVYRIVQGASEVSSSQQPSYRIQAPPAGQQGSRYVVKRHLPLEPSSSQPTPKAQRLPLSQTSALAQVLTSTTVAAYSMPETEPVPEDPDDFDLENIDPEELARSMFASSAC